ncbi:hypothetical protein [Pseudonocardia broussonetiae]|uniref:Uncharacterized protein n=1 Tax=Pseudonocardia broussonetiae TaxID=2736640 RepID=A0A6M6JUP0_9PSEU|nr:hypothetical protein [Pseudonocardia broussonetiae]QJY51200.1 hypothetical protein HOP40_35030 [Pseudonocardia broussonetiae]QJY51214.1 hypothetical protein HOP40_35105 [Pseudonocardia broussonetiae]
MLDTVKVAPETFSNIEFRGAMPKTAYVPQGNVAGPQKQTSNGTPIWAVRVLAETTRGLRVKEDLLTVTVPMQVDPTEKFERGQSIELVSLTFGVTPKREGNGFSTWLSADGIQPAGLGKAAAS